MIEVAIIGFSIGLASSLHCLVMCGPISLALPLGNLTTTQKVFSILKYNLGRIITYLILGALFGALGSYINPLELQQSISIGIGILLIIGFILLYVSKFQISSYNKIYNIIKSQIVSQVKSRNFFLLGFFNGLLPCGFVYLAIATAIVAGSTANSILLMSSFGLATLPMMLGLAFGGVYLLQSIKNKLQKLAPYSMLFLGTILILRGMDLGIPYLSPKQNLAKDNTQINCYPISKSIK
jgi:hypothetical protein